MGRLLPGERRLGAVAHGSQPGRVATLPAAAARRSTRPSTASRCLPGERRSGDLRSVVTLRQRDAGQGAERRRRAATGRRSCGRSTARGAASTRWAASARRPRGTPVERRDGVRRGAARGDGRGPRSRDGRIEGGSTADGSTAVPLLGLLGDGRPLRRRSIRLLRPGRSASRRRGSRIVASPVLPRRTLTPPAGSTWAEAARLDRTLDSRACSRSPRTPTSAPPARTQFDTFLANPGPDGRGVNTADYVYVTAPPRATPAPRPADGGGLGARSVLVARRGRRSARGRRRPRRSLGAPREKAIRKSFSRTWCSSRQTRHIEKPQMTSTATKRTPGTRAARSARNGEKKAPRSTTISAAAP